MIYFDWRRAIMNLALDVEYCAFAAKCARQKGEPDDLERAIRCDAEATKKASYAAWLAWSHCRKHRKSWRVKSKTTRIKRASQS